MAITMMMMMMMMMMVITRGDLWLLMLVGRRWTAVSGRAVARVESTSGQLGAGTGKGARGNTRLEVDICAEDVEVEGQSKYEQRRVRWRAVGDQHGHL